MNSVACIIIVENLKCMSMGGGKYECDSQFEMCHIEIKNIFRCALSCVTYAQAKYTFSQV